MFGSNFHHPVILGDSPDFERIALPRPEFGLRSAQGLTEDNKQRSLSAQVASHLLLGSAVKTGAENYHPVHETPLKAQQAITGTRYQRANPNAYMGTLSHTHIEHVYIYLPKHTHT